MTAGEFEQWMLRYGKAWEAGSPEDALSLFSADAEYFETPFDPPLIGHEAIRRYWTEGAKNAQRHVRFEARCIAFDGRTGYASWRATFERVSSGARVELDGVLSAQFDSKMRCVVFKEWWHRRETPGSSGA
jgi:hypothetical protein